MPEHDDDGVKAISAVMGALKSLDDKTRLNVLQYVLKQLEIDLPLAASGTQRTTSNELASAVFEGLPEPQPRVHGDKDIRTLADEKHPKTVNEKVALLAFYLKNLAPADEQKDQISSEDITTYFPQADFELPQAPGMALTHAKNAGYLISLGNGKYRLNAVGHNLVSHRMPAGETVPRTRRKRTLAKKRL